MPLLRPAVPVPTDVLAPPAMPGWPIESLLFMRLPAVPVALLVVAPVGLLVVAPVEGRARGPALPAPVVVDVVLATPLEAEEPGLPGLAVLGLAAPPVAEEAPEEPEAPPEL